MCGRYAAAKDAAALVEEFEVDETLVAEALTADYNVAPTKPVPLVITRHSKGGDDEAPPSRQLVVARWGLVPSWAKDPSIGSRMINARMETVADKPAYKRAFAARRCLLPAAGYYEWYTPTARASDESKTKGGKPKKQPFFVHRRDGESLAMAGLYEWWLDKSRDRSDPAAWLMTTTVITTSATDELGRIHDRMPVVVDRENWDTWLDPGVESTEQLQPLLAPAASTVLDAYPVSTDVNNVRNNGPELLQPLPPEEVPPGIEV